MSALELTGRRRLRRWQWCLLVVGVLFGLQLATAATVWAHATVVRSDPGDGTRVPTSPSQVSITFDESVDISVGYLQVISATGTRVDTGSVNHLSNRGNVISVALQPSLPPNTYFESWRVLSADSHPVAGTVRFVVGNGPLNAAAAPSVAPAQRSVRVAVYVARAFSYFGLALFGGAWLVFTAWPAGRADRRARRLLAVGWAVLLAAAVAEVLLQGVYAAGTGFSHLLDDDLVASTSSSAFGRLHAIRLVLLSALGIVVFAFPTPPLQRNRRIEQAVAAALGVGVVSTFSGSGHDSVLSPRWLMITSDAAHLGAASAWVGGLVLMGAALLRGRGDDAYNDAGNDGGGERAGNGDGPSNEVLGSGVRLSRVQGTAVQTRALEHSAVELSAVQLSAVQPSAVQPSAVVGVFSKVAAACVAVITVTGTYQAWRQVGSVGALFDTGYGRLILVKVALLAALVAVAAGSRRIVRPASGLTGLRRRVLVETGLAMVVLAVTAVLVTLPPGRDAISTASRSATVSLGTGRSATVRVDPARSGPVAVELTLTPAEPATVTITAALPAAGIGPLPVPLVRQPNGRYAASAVTLPHDGRWTFALVVRRSEFDAVTADVTIKID